MTRIRHYINGQDYGSPRNWQDLEITVDWLNKKDEANINITDLEFVLEAKDYLLERILNGTSGGVGIFEGEPYTIKVNDNSLPEFTFDGYLDFADESTFIGNEEVICSLKKVQGNDWLNDVADGFSFAYLADKGFITNGDYVKVPYVINYVPDGMQIIILSMSIYMMTKELIENVQRLADTIGDVTDAAVPVIGVSVGFGAGVVTAWDLGNFILVVIKTVARIAYIIAITIAIIKLVEEVFEQLLPKKRYHSGIRIKTLFERACQYLNLQLQSNLLNEIGDWVYIPSKDRKGDSGDKGHPINSDPIYTFGDCIRIFKEKFNADYRIKNGIFYFERKDSFEVVSSYQIPNFFSDQERLLDRISFNANEIISNYNIFWQYDVQDQNTLDDQTGRVFQAITTPVTVQNQKLVNIKNLAQISLPFSLGKTKTDLTKVEEIAKDLGRIVDSITGIFGGGTNFASQIQNRLGSLLLSSHFLTVPKIVVVSGSKLANDQRTLLSSRSLWDKYHYINSFAEVNGFHNQYQRFEGQRIPMKLKNFNDLLSNNIGTDANGNRFEIEKFVWRPEDQTAVIDYRVKKKYTNNLKIEYVE